MTDPSLYWASTQANPDKPKVVVLRLFKPALNHRSMADVMRDEAHCEAMRKARKPRLVSDAWADLSPDAFTNSARKDGEAVPALSQSPERSRRRKDDPLARRDGGESPS